VFTATICPGTILPRVARCLIGTRCTPFGCNGGGERVAALPSEHLLLEPGNDVRVAVHVDHGVLADRALDVRTIPVFERVVERDDAVSADLQRCIHGFLLPLSVP
jgi:hypothetical protein